MSGTFYISGGIDAATLSKVHARQFILVLIEMGTLNTDVDVTELLPV